MDVSCAARRSSPQINLLAQGGAKAVPLGAKRYAIARANQPGTFAVLGPDFMGGEGELDVTAWDKTHVAGTFQFSAKGRTYKGRFDLKCPYASYGGCK